MNRCVDFCNIFTELCTTLSYYFIHHPNTVLGDFNCINLLLMCASHKDYEVSRRIRFRIEMKSNDFSFVRFSKSRLFSGSTSLKTFTRIVIAMKRVLIFKIILKAYLRHYASIADFQ